MEQLRGLQVISLAGYQGSGKSTIGKKLARVLGVDVVEVSDVVKTLHEGLSRSQLPDTGKLTKEDPDWLAREVGNQLAISMATNEKNVVVLTGPREVEIHKYLKKVGAQVWGIEIDTESYLRHNRLLNLGKVKTTEEFLLHELKERELGLPKLLDTLSLICRTSEETKPENLARGIFAVLKKKGMKWES